MATYTTHYNLIKPALNDKVNINNLNDNADIIDTALYNKVNTSDTENIITSADKCMLSDGVTSVEDAITNLVKTETKQVTVTSDANHVVMLGVSKPNVVVNIEIEGVIVLGYTTYANEWLCSLADYSGSQVTSGTYTATIYYI